MSHVCFASYFFPFCRPRPPLLFIGDNFTTLPFRFFHILSAAPPPHRCNCFLFLLKNIGVFFSSKYLPFLSPKLLSFQNEVAVFLFSVPNFQFAKQALLPTETMPFALQNSLFCFSKAFTCGSRLCSVLSPSICLLPIKLCLLFYKALSVAYKTLFVVFYKLHLCLRHLMYGISIQMNVHIMSAIFYIINMLHFRITIRFNKLEIIFLFRLFVACTM